MRHGRWGHGGGVRLGAPAVGWRGVMVDWGGELGAGWTARWPRQQRRHSNPAAPSGRGPEPRERLLEGRELAAQRRGGGARGSGSHSVSQPSAYSARPRPAWGCRGPLLQGAGPASAAGGHEPAGRRPRTRAREARARLGPCARARPLGTGWGAGGWKGGPAVVQRAQPLRCAWRGCQQVRGGGCFSGVLVRVVTSVLCACACLCRSTL